MGAEQAHRATVSVPFAPNGGCGILECGRERIALGMCWNHYQRARRGAPLYVYLTQGSGNKLTALAFGPPKPPWKERRRARLLRDLDALMTPEPNTGCWLWLGGFYPETGYGQLGYCGDPWGGYAHRAALYLRGTGLEQGNHKRQVRHLCDQPACVNPAHLVYGTALENAADRAKSVRWRAWLVRLAESPRDYVRPAKVYANGRTIRQMAEEAGLSAETVRSRIKAGWSVERLMEPPSRAHQAGWAKRRAPEAA